MFRDMKFGEVLIKDKAKVASRVGGEELPIRQSSAYTCTSASRVGLQFAILF